MPVGERINLTFRHCVRKPRHPVLGGGLAVLAACLLVSCWPEPGSPEGQLRAMFVKAERAVEEKDIGALKDLVSDHYADTRGHDKQSIIGLLKFYFFRHKSIHLLTQIRPASFPDSTLAEVTVFVAMAGQPISGAEQLAILRADLHRFDFQLASESSGDWKVFRAEWRRAQLSDFL